MLAKVLQIRHSLSAVQDSMGQYEDHSAFTLPGLYRVISVRLCYSLRISSPALCEHGIADYAVLSSQHGKRCLALAVKRLSAYMCRKPQKCCALLAALMIQDLGREPRQW